jgi:hypothetical protein
MRWEYSPEELRDFALFLNTLLHIRGPSSPGLPPRDVVAGDLLALQRPPWPQRSDFAVALQNLLEAGSGVARGWNNNQDDLGWPSVTSSRARYLTPYHYGWRLHELSRATGARSYGDFRERHAVTARLAGAPMRIHPRAIYFVAAAQLEMDRASDIHYQGHYIAPPALMGAIRDLRRQLRPILRRAPRRRRGRSAEPAWQMPLEQRRQRLQAIVADARQIVASARAFRAVNRANVATRLSPEQPEAIVEWLLGPEATTPEPTILPEEGAPPPAPPTRAEEIDAMPETIAGDGPAVDAQAAALLALLDNEPGRWHWMGAMDAHGSAHAMGLAIDYVTS